MSGPVIPIYLFSYSFKIFVFLVQHIIVLVLQWLNNRVQAFKNAPRDCVCTDEFGPLFPFPLRTVFDIYNKMSLAGDFIRG